jgi:membrane protease YdiL (CAAX protease family)
MVAFVAFLQLVFAQDGSNADAETLAYQAIIPGIDEELIFRGLLLALLAGALREFERGWMWAGIAVTIIFAFGHSIFWTPDGPFFDPVTLFYVTVLGALMMYIRLGTGSILLPILAHNITNVVNQLL